MRRTHRGGRQNSVVSQEASPSDAEEESTLSTVHVESLIFRKLQAAKSASRGAFALRAAARPKLL